MVETYIVTNIDNEIIRIYETSQGISGIEQSILNENIAGTIIKVPNLFEGNIGDSIQDFDAEWNLKITYPVKVNSDEAIENESDY